MKVKEQLLTLSPYKPGKPIEEVKKEYNLETVVKLASNENPYGCSNRVKEAIYEELNHMALYPDGYSAELRTALAEYLHVKDEQLIFGNGSDEVIQIICRALLSPETNTVMATPTFPQYRHNAVIEGAEIREVPLRNGDHDLSAMLSAIDEQTTVVWVCSPNNPTGTYVKQKDLMEFIKQVPKHTLIVMDEAYYEYAAQEEDFPQTVDLLDEYENLIVLRTFSKAYGLASLRIGYGIANEALLQRIEPAREPFNTSRMAQKAAVEALKDQDFINECKRKNEDGLQQYYAFCEKNGLNYYPSYTNFVLIDFGQPGDEVFQFLLERGYIVRSGNALGFPTSARITIGTKEQNEQIIQLLQEYVSKHKSFA
ncbi:histidinol-phosphate transaminase [Priestia flexa]|uniref:Histidinol-phosphate aminotransferase n=1 Tax=Priestia flexa TaxID=86664 RepID=A0A8I1MBR3_9BACI|nr:histidinol-phosphate transaminase [Priestia flexa]MBN8250215.1 histidinol-phosphate transaminase [Priestia flexa]MBN8432963.1 histidinol-phosphate transaminase [Priestia flexa]MCA0965051.1 histidinol-phosphate transaminase [Priestia flexa]RIV15645.1 histidinol-phosphate transaminase [Priestia flexa]UIR29127.1 histidinol-phosphate transaminase [Priestia flexa]